MQRRKLLDKIVIAGGGDSQYFRSRVHSRSRCARGNRFAQGL